MYALDLRMNETAPERLQPAPDVDFQREWQARHRHRRLYIEESAAKRVKRTRVRYRIAWDRVLLVFVVLASVATFRTNAGLESQYLHDLKTTYKGVLKS